MKNTNKVMLGMITLFFLILFGLVLSFIIHSPKVEKNISFSLLPLDSPTQNLPADLPKYLYNQTNQLSLTYPQNVWRQENEQINMTITPGNLMDPQTPQSPGTYNYYFEARLDLDSTQLTTGGTIIEPFKPKQKALFNWGIIPQSGDVINGSLWVYFHISNPSITDQWQITRFAIPIHIQVISLLGLSMNTIRFLLLFFMLLVAILIVILSFLSGKDRKKAG